MKVFSLLLVLGAAFLHALWNMIAKKAQDVQAFLWLSLCAFCMIFFLPFIFFSGPISSDGWFFIVFSAIFETFYYLLLGDSYQATELSYVYPLARGSIPLFVLIFGRLFLKEGVSSKGLAGIVTIVCGIYLAQLPSLDLKGFFTPLRVLKKSALRKALLIGVMSASYTLIDRRGVTLIHPASYIYLVFLLTTIFLTPFMLWKKDKLILLELKTAPLEMLLVALFSAGAYLLVLFALQRNNAAYIASVREVSIVIISVLSFFVLKERFAVQRIIGSIIIFAGIFIIALSR